MKLMRTRRRCHAVTWWWLGLCVCALLGMVARGAGEPAGATAAGTATTPSVDVTVQFLQVPEKTAKDRGLVALRRRLPARRS